MARQHYRTPFKKALLQFITEPDPFLAMFKWVMSEMMGIEPGQRWGSQGETCSGSHELLLRSSGPEGGCQAIYSNMWRTERVNAFTSGRKRSLDP